MRLDTYVLTATILACLAGFLGGCGSSSTAFSRSICPDCNGESNSSICSTCWGEGYRIEENRASQQRCATCLGTGRNNTMYRPTQNETIARYASICPSCSGRGQNRIITPIRVFCQRCDGTGKGRTPVICGRCRGSGQWKGVFRAGKNLRGWIPMPSQAQNPDRSGQ